MYIILKLILLMVLSFNYLYQEVKTVLKPEKLKLVLNPKYLNLYFLITYIIYKYIILFLYF